MRKQTKRTFKKALLISSLSTMLISGNINNRVRSEDIEVPKEVKVENIEELQQPIEVNSEINEACEYVLEKYNALGHDLTKESLGCALETSPYLFKDTDTNKCFYDTSLFAPKENQIYVNDIGENEVYVFIDKTNESRAIAGIAKVENKITNVDIDAYTSHSLVIKSDKNNYIEFDLDEEKMQKMYEDTKKYYEERLKIVKSR